MWLKFDCTLCFMESHLYNGAYIYTKCVKPDKIFGESLRDYMNRSNWMRCAREAHKKFLYLNGEDNRLMDRHSLNQ